MSMVCVCGVAADEEADSTTATKHDGQMVAQKVYCQHKGRDEQTNNQRATAKDRLGFANQCHLALHTAIDPNNSR